MFSQLEMTDHQITLRTACPNDLEDIKELTVASFGGVTLEQNLEQKLGTFRGHDWRWRKARHIDDDFATNPSGIFVAEADRKIVGYITTHVDHESGKGR